MTHVVADLGPLFLQKTGDPLDMNSATLTVGGQRVQGTEAFSRFASLAHEHDVKALFHVGGYDAYAMEAMSQWLGDPSRLAQVIADACATTGMDGILWEHYNITARDTSATTDLIRALHAANPELLFASDTLGGNHASVLNGDLLDYAHAIAADADYVGIRMTDGIGNDAPWSVWHYVPLHDSPSVPGAHPYSMEIGLGQYTNPEQPTNLDPKRMGAELPMWGVGVGPLSPTSTGAQMTQPGVDLAGPNDWSLFSWGRARRDWPVRRIVSEYVSVYGEQWDDASGASYVSIWPPLEVQGFESETNVDFRYLSFVSYESERAAAAKGDYLRCHGFGGAFVRTMNDATLTDGTNPVLRALANGLRSSAACP
jgi:Glycosyl hydrolases family 18